MQIVEWADLPPDAVAALLRREQGRWLQDLDWDSAPTWDAVESARRAGQLPGLAAIEDGRTVGWTFFLVRDRILQIGALAGTRAEVVRALLDAALDAPVSALARRYHCFVFPESPAVEAALVRRRFAVEPYLYLERPLAAVREPSASSRVEPWSETELPAAVRLLARAYAGTGAGRCFAPNGRLDEWTWYVAQLLRTRACGRFAAEASFVASGAGACDGPGGLVLSTTLGAGSAHVAQVAVDPALRRTGLATVLLDTAAAASRAGGAVRQTLLVASGNAPARALYARSGFVERARFLFADRDRITRTSPRRATTDVPVGAR